MVDILYYPNERKAVYISEGRIEEINIVDSYPTLVVPLENPRRTRSFLETKTEEQTLERRN